MIDDKIFNFNKILGIATNKVVFYTSNDNKNILIKQATKYNLKVDIKVINKLEDKK